MKLSAYRILWYIQIFSKQLCVCEDKYSVGTACDLDLPDPPPADGVDDESDEHDGAERGPDGNGDHVVGWFQRLRSRGCRLARGCEMRGSVRLG